MRNDIDDICEVVVTGYDVESLVALTKQLLEAELVACGQHIEQVRSVYKWDGRVHDEPEARVALHTRTDLVDDLMAAISSAHPYDVPCVLVLPVRYAHPGYRQWVRDQCRSGEGLFSRGTIAP